MLDDIRRCSLESALDDVTARLDGCDGIMLSLDMDALASAFAPGVSAPASDGFQPADVFRVIERISALPRCRLVEIVEVNPTVDIDERTARLAANFAASVMWMFANRKNDADSSLNLGSSSNNQ
jgi:formiminoglutamase